MSSPWIVVPTYNEKTNIENLIPDLFSLGIENMTVLVVDDNSPDGTATVVRELQNKYPNLELIVREKKDGLGGAYIHGFQIAIEKGATAVVQMDADYSHDPKDIPKLLEKLNEADLVIGSRYAHGISVINWPLRRLLLSIAGNVYAQVITGIPIKDATGGFKAWRAETLKGIDLTSVQADGYGFQIVLNYRAWKQGKKIVEVPIIFTERREGQSKMSKKIVFEALLLVWKLRFGIR